MGGRRRRGHAAQCAARRAAHRREALLCSMRATLSRALLRPCVNSCHLPQAAAMPRARKRDVARRIFLLRLTSSICTHAQHARAVDGLEVNGIESRERRLTFCRWAGGLRRGHPSAKGASECTIAHVLHSTQKRCLRTDGGGVLSARLARLSTRHRTRN